MLMSCAERVKAYDYMLRNRYQTIVIMEQHFLKFRSGIAGVDVAIPTTDGNHAKLVYADWAASGRNYLPIEDRIQKEIMPLMTNIEAEVNHARVAMTYAYHSARQVIKEHINASPEDVLITASSGATMLIKRLQAILGLSPRTHAKQYSCGKERPVVFITHMEHYSNHKSWIETDAIVEIIEPDLNGLVSFESLHKLLSKYKDYPLKIASITACSNITGVILPFESIAKIMHANGGFLFVDFSCSAPYVSINMHPAEKDTHLDAIFFSAHKFLGGPGSTGVLAFNQCLYGQVYRSFSRLGQLRPCEDSPTVKIIEAQECDGTPALLQTIKTAMCIRLKEEMGISNILSQEKKLLVTLLKELELIPNLHILLPQHRERIAIISFCIEGLNPFAGARLLNDKFAIQCKASYAIPGSYGDALLREHSQSLEQEQRSANRRHTGEYHRRGWIRISLHPVMTKKEVQFIAQCITQLAGKHQEWRQDYFPDKLKRFHSIGSNEISSILEKRIDSLFICKFTQCS